VIAPERESFVFELGVGPIPVSLEWDANGLSFAWMTQLLPSFGAQIADRSGFATATGLVPDDLEDLPIEEVSCGVAFLFAPVKTRAAVDRIEIDRRALARVYQQAKCDDLAVFFFTTDRSGATGDETVYSRMLAPQFGVAEDPATGGASGPLGSYLLHHRVVSDAQARSMISLQGVAMKRPSRIHISIDSDGGTITRVRVGGKSVLVAEGTLLV
jgi:trans-2,3-dihydro-3-hydroxyanthranilate isomerase